MDFQLTNDQQAAKAAFISFLASNDTELVISGSAGVGKTTLLNHLMNMQDANHICRLLGKKPITDWVLTATTNKAAEVLAIATGREAGTIHSLLGLQVYNDYKTGRSSVSRKKNHEITENKLIVIDECSMIDRNLYRLIKESTVNCKIIYVGDHCQLAPIMEELSPVFLEHNREELNEIIRSKGSPAITALANQLRETVETGVFQRISEVPGIIDFLTPTEAVAEINTVFKVERADARILCYTNRTVQELNDHVRKLRDKPAHYEAGECVISNSALQIDAGRRLRIEEEIIIEEVKELRQHIVTTFSDGQLLLPVYDLETSAGSLSIAVDPAQMQHYLKVLAKDKNWGPYFDLKERIVDLRPRDACTVYKAQGSTYHTVFVHLADIGICTNAAQAARMLYVACSRPTDRICFIGNLPDRFLGE